MRQNDYNLTMNIENLTTLQPRDMGNWQDVERPILSMPYCAKGPHRIAGHQHPRAQILYPVDGVYRVNTPLGNWVVPPTQAIWIPSHTFHEVYANGSVNSLIFFVDEPFTAPLPHECIVINVSPLLRELFNKAIEVGNDYIQGGRQSRFFTVLLDELNEMKPAPLHLPLARDKRVRHIMEILLDNPSEQCNFEELAMQSGASIRTLERTFKKETGMSFSEWRSMLRLQEAIDQLAQGQTVSQVAIDLGYNSTSAFIAMFKRTLGVPPGKYFS